MGLLARALPVSILALSSAAGIAAIAEPPAEAHRALLVRTPPSYPELARRMHISGNVVLVVEIRPDGTVGDARVQSGHALLRQAAEDAVRHWRFVPGPAAVISVAVAFTGAPE